MSKEMTPPNNNESDLTENMDLPMTLPSGDMKFNNKGSLGKMIRNMRKNREIEDQRDRYKDALETVKQHIEVSQPDLYKLSASWNIIDQALTPEEVDNATT